ncbi:MAG TPA: hypothetical protein VGC41_04450, partial [Kofleriaceae bacterium]
MASAGVELQHPVFGAQTTTNVWIAKQPEARASYTMTWRAAWFLDDGGPAHANGVMAIESTSGNRAREEAFDRLEDRFPRRPIRLRVGGHERARDARWPYQRIDVHHVRRYAVTSGKQPSMIARSVISVAPDTTP